MNNSTQADSTATKADNIQLSASKQLQTTADLLGDMVYAYRLTPSDVNYQAVLDLANRLTGEIKATKRGAK